MEHRALDVCGLHVIGQRELKLDFFAPKEARVSFVRSHERVDVGRQSVAHAVLRKDFKAGFVDVRDLGFELGEPEPRA